MKGLVSVCWCRVFEAMIACHAQACNGTEHQGEKKYQHRNLEKLLRNSQK